jgi:lipoprotein-releasing system ATP-binding protein
MLIISRFHKGLPVSHRLLAQHLAKSFPTPAGPLSVLTDISLDRASNHGPLAILGPSGSGKSTLLHILGSLDTPTAGTLSLDGVNPLSLTPAALAHYRATHVGFVFQDHHLLPQLTALENVLIARLALGPVRAEHRARAQELLHAVNLADRQTHLPSELSGGQRQRVAIARALMNSPALILCDEPTGDLDAVSAAAIGELLHAAARQHNAILILATHSETLAATCPQRMQLAGGLLLLRHAGAAVP